jgi:amidase
MKYLVSLICTISLLAGCAPEPGQVAYDDYSEHDIATLQKLMQEGELSSAQLTEYYLQRIDSIDRGEGGLNAIIEVNPDALETAKALDEERAVSGPRGPMHGIPVVLKANIDTADQMATTAGSLALAGHRPPEDAFVVAQLRASGAVILAKANLSEWANFRSDYSSSGWSSIGGQTNNAYDVSRNPCGSSSGSAVAVAASLTSVAVGTETNGSVVCPSSVNGIVGIKPTLGLVSRSGIIPIAHSQDTAGPMGRTVEDAAILLTAMVGADPADPLADKFPDSVPDFAANLSTDALQGARIGVFRNHRGADNDPRVQQILENTIATLKSLGAEVVDPVEIDREGMGDASGTVLYYEFKADLNAYLENSGAQLKTLADIIAFNNEHADEVMPFFGQDAMLDAQEMGPLSDPEYLEALVRSKEISQNAINNALQENNLDALIAPTRGPAWMTDNVSGDHSSGISSSSLAAISGYASITLPAGDILGLPIGISFIGGEFSDAELIRFAYALEQGGYVRKPPKLPKKSNDAGGSKTSSTAPAADTGKQVGIVLMGDAGYNIDYQSSREGATRSAEELRQWYVDRLTLKGVPDPEGAVPPFSVLPGTDYTVMASGQVPVIEAADRYCTDHARCDFGLLLGDNIYPNGATEGTDGKPDAKRFQDILVTPYESWFSRQPDFQFDAVFGNHDWYTSVGGAIAQLKFMESDPHYFMDGMIYTRRHETPIGNIDVFAIDTQLLLSTVVVPTPQLTEEGDVDEHAGIEVLDPWITEYAIAGPDQVAWLQEQLQASDARWKIVIAHHPLWSSGGSKFAQAQVLRQLLLPVLCPSADIYIAGHEHTLEVHEQSCERYAGSPPGKLPHIVSGAAGKQRTLNYKFAERQAETMPGFAPLWAQGMIWGFVHLNLADDNATVTVVSTPDDASGDVVVEYEYEFVRRTADSE